MNRHIDGRVLSTVDLARIAVVSGVPPAEITRRSAIHDKDLLRSWLLTVTAEERLAMMARGELKLDITDQPVRYPTLDRQVLDCLRRVA